MAIQPCTENQRDVAAGSDDISTSAFCTQEDMTAFLPMHPRTALWQPGMRTPKQHQEIRKWINSHPCSDDGLVQKSLWLHFSKKRKRTETNVGDASLPWRSVNATFRMERSFEFTPFVRPEIDFVTKLEEVGGAVCSDVIGERGTPSIIGMFVEIKGGGFWTGHVDVTNEQEEMNRQKEGGMQQNVAQSALGRLFMYFKKNMVSGKDEYDMCDVKRFTVRIAYSTS